MKILILVFSIFVISAISGEALAENWHEVIGENNFAVEVDLDSITNFIVYKEAWVRLDFHKNGGQTTNGGGEIVWYSSMHTKFRCLDKRMAVDAVSQSGPSAVYHNLDVPKEKITWSPVDPADKGLSAIFSFICK